MKKEAGFPLPNFFDRYINLTEDIDLVEGLIKYSPDYVFSIKEDLEKLGDYVYLPGKWTIKQILQHCIDTERIMAYRALCFARKDFNKLPGYEEDDYANNAQVEKRSISDLLEEFNLVRESNICMFKSLNNEQLLHLGNANNSEISPLHLGFVIIGHPIHHMNVIKERYLS